jgi:pimeloyl-ACP methyl ester carboxylesterase
MIFKYDDAEIYYEIHGAGEPVLLIGGLASDSQSWISVTNALSTQYRIIVFDNRGSGRTESNEESLSISLMAKDAKELISYLGLEKVKVIGHSMGGLIALELAAMLPDKIDKVIVAGTPYEISQRNRELLQSWVDLKNEGIPDDLWFRNLFYWILTPEFFENEPLLQGAITLSVNYPYNPTTEQFSRQIGAINDFSLNSILPEIKCECLVIAAEKDILFSVEECRELSLHIPSSKFEIIPGAAHSIHSEKPMELVRAVSTFLVLG